MTTCIVATTKPWNLEAYGRWAQTLPGEWALVTTPNHLAAMVNSLQPRYVFFPHWSWRVPEDILAATECVCFHMSDVPYGRGGSPLQNLIVRGHRETRLSALRMTAEVDAGPVYAKVPLSLAGRAEDIYREAARRAFELIEWIVAHEPEPQGQVGEVVTFPRRRPEESRLPSATAQTPLELYDHIRMLDAPTYPHAFIRDGAWRIELTHAECGDDCVRGQFVITKEHADDE